MRWVRTCGERVIDILAQCAQISVQLRLGGHGERTVRSLGVAEALVGAEEEGLVSPVIKLREDYRSAERSSELVLRKVGLGRGDGLEGWAGIEDGVAGELPTRAM